MQLMQPRLREMLDDGFSPPHHVRNQEPSTEMTIHRPAQPDPSPAQDEPGAPNPSQLPVEPEFGPELPPSEPEDPGAKPPHP
jgi:hypothetical protein